MTDFEAYNYGCRIQRLMNPPRLMSIRAATIVVEAAMFGNGCVEGKVREEIALTKEQHTIIVKNKET